MPFTELAALLPCHSLEDFPLYHEGAAAEELLAAWCALWHPALLADARAVPTWHRIDMPPEDDRASRLLAIPPSFEDRLPSGFLADCEQIGAPLVRQQTRQAAVATALDHLDQPCPNVDAELAADFLALGYCTLQMELLSRQMRYSPNIDEPHLRDEAVAAATAAVAGDVETARSHLQHCFDTLDDSRQHFYPVDVHLLDVTLLAATTIGAPLAAELTAGTPINVLATSAVLAQLAGEQPDNWGALLKAIDAAKACILGGEREESELPLLPVEAALANLRAGSDDYELLLGRRPVVYGRRRAGLCPALVQLLSKLAYQGALHCTLDDGRFPLAAQAKSRWEGGDMSVLDVFARVPGDAAKPETFLSLARTISDTMDNDHVATVALAHWPGSASPYYDDLRRISRYSPVLGQFALLDDYFTHTDMPGQLSRFEADEYRTPYLKQAIIRRQSDPLSHVVQAHRRQAEATARASLGTVCELIGGSQSAGPAGAVEDCEPLAAALDRFAAMLPRANRPAAPRALVFNPASYRRRFGLELEAWQTPPAVGGAVVAAGSSGERQFAVVDVPSMGFESIEPAAAAPEGKNEQPIATENKLVNEFCEVRINRQTGGIGGVYKFRQRGNQLSQQLAFRRSGGGTDDPYTTMRAESLQVTATCPAYGEIVSTGVLLDAADQARAKFRQTARLWAGIPVIGLTIELSDVEEPRADPWNSYYAARFAWPDENAQLYRGVSSVRERTAAGRLEAPEFIDVETGNGALTILTGGLPYHRRSDPRMLDSLLIVRGETARRFELAVGVDLEHPAAAAFDRLTPPAVHWETAAPAERGSGWFFHVGTKNLAATHWRPLVDESDETERPPQVVGFAVRLLEVGGQAGQVPLRTFRSVAAARQVDFLGEPILELPVENDKIMLDVGAHELIEVHARWADV